jgi:hypothetical protein
LNFCVVRAKHLAQIVGTALIETLRAGKFEPTCLNGEPVAIKWNASVMFRIAPFRQAP